MEIIGLSGRKGCGKTYLVNYCINNLGYININFADSLKEIICKLFCIDNIFLEKHKNDINLEPLKLYLTNEELSNLLGINIGTKVLTFYSIREAMQFIGTDIIRNECPDWHLNKFKEKIQNIEKNRGGLSRLLIIGDVRFESEKKLLEKLNGKLFYILSPFNKEISNHKSETELSWTNFGSNILINKYTNDFINEFEDKLKNKSLTIIDVFSNIKFCKPNLKNAFIMGLFINCGEYKNGTIIFFFKKIEKHLNYVLEFFDDDKKQKKDLVTIENAFIIENLKKWNIHNKSFPDTLKENTVIVKMWIYGFIVGFNNSKNINCDISIIEKLPKDCYLKLNNPKLSKNNKCLINIDYNNLVNWFLQKPSIYDFMISNN